MKSIEEILKNRILFTLKIKSIWEIIRGARRIYHFSSNTKYDPASLNITNTID